MESIETSRRNIQFYRISTQAGQTLDWKTVDYNLRRYASTTFPRMPIDKSTADTAICLPFVDGIALNPTTAGRVKTGDRAFPDYVFARVRSDGHPDMELGGSLGDLPLPAGANIAELIYVAVVAPRILGIVKNQYGLYRNHLAKYFTEYGAPEFKEPETSNVAITELIDRDVLIKVEKASAFKKFQVKLRSDSLEAVRGASGELDEALDASYRFAKGEHITLTLSASRSPNDHLSKYLGPAVLNLCKKATYLEQLCVSIINQDGYYEKDINLLEERIIFSRNIARRTATAKSVAIIPAFEAIRATFNEKREKIETAMGLDAPMFMDADAVALSRLD